jgi:CheY-like chemotaxis protein
VFADPSQLDAALLNLALNARDAMPRGGRLRIEARAAVIEPGAGERPGRYVAFAVRDTGVGMAPEVLDRAFEPFFTTKSAGKGSGLGLSMVYGFVTQSGGHLAVDSELGYGTTIELFLPAAEAPAASTMPAGAAPVRRGSGTVLVVEDEPDVRQVAVGFVRSLGYEPIAAADAASALEAFDRHPHVDAVFSDVALGVGPDGRELARELRRRRPGLPILLTSGFEGAAEAGDVPDLPLLPKPYRREDLAEALRRVLEPER